MSSVSAEPAGVTGRIANALVDNAVNDDFQSPSMTRRKRSSTDHWEISRSLVNEKPRRGFGASIVREKPFCPLLFVSVQRMTELVAVSPIIMQPLQERDRGGLMRFAR